MSPASGLAGLESEIVSCRRCPRLADYCRRVALEKRRSWRDQEYWGKPVPGFGDPEARLYVLGLAPAAHGANRTGRVFTGDRSGDFLYRALHATGFASQPTSVDRQDGLALRDAWIGAAVRCAPPDNRPLPEETRNCRAFLERELALLQRVQVVAALGRFAFEVYLSIARDAGLIASPRQFPFRHGAEHRLPGGLPRLISSYHPSQQNTSTGKLTFPMLRAVFERARALLDGEEGA